MANLTKYSCFSKPKRPFVALTDSILCCSLKIPEKMLKNITGQYYVVELSLRWPQIKCKHAANIRLHAIRIVSVWVTLTNFTFNKFRSFVHIKHRQHKTPSATNIPSIKTSLTAWQQIPFIVQPYFISAINDVFAFWRLQWSSSRTHNVNDTSTNTALGQIVFRISPNIWRVPIQIRWCWWSVCMCGAIAWFVWTKVVLKPLIRLALFLSSMSSPMNPSNTRWTSVDFIFVFEICENCRAFWFKIFVSEKIQDT